MQITGVISTGKLIEEDFLREISGQFFKGVEQEFVGSLLQAGEHPHPPSLISHTSGSAS